MTLEKIYIAALLHDIGKFGQRADSANYERSDYLEQKIKNNASSFCPTATGGYNTHIHTLYTAKFISTHKSLFQNFTELGNADSLLHLSAAHHKPYEFMEHLLTYADHLSAGSERVDAGNANEENDVRKFRDTPLQSAFSNLNISKDGGKFDKMDAWFFALSTSNPNTGNFSQKDKPALDYTRFWNEFNSELASKKYLPSTQFFTFQFELLKILEKFTSFIPSSTQRQPDVSLFDHLKNVAAYAQALYSVAQEQNISEVSALKNVEAPFLLFGLDISGIQSFIYNIVSNRASRNLKGRSFYLHALITSINQIILNELGLYHAAIVYESGGKAFIIGPNTPKTLGKLAALKRRIEDAIYHTHKLSLSIALEWVEIRKDQLIKQIIHEPWSALMTKLSDSKKRRLLNQIQQFPALFFSPSGAGGRLNIDHVSGEEHPESELIKDEDDPEKMISQFSIYLAKLGKDLHEKDIWVITSQRINDSSHNICGLGLFHTFLNINEFKTLPQYIARAFTDGYTFPAEYYGGYEFPEDTRGNIKTFEDLARQEGGSNDESALKRLGVLRMDVDNLGTQFIRGFKENERTFSRYAALSRSLDLFFKGYLNVIRRKQQYKDVIQVIYSGGDDIFAVGRWDKLLTFAADVRSEFRIYVCNHPLLTLSGGITLIPAKFPVLKAAELTGEAEDLAKDKPGKNAITVLDTALCWDDELPFVLSLKHNILAFRQKEGGLPSAFISNVLNWKESVKEYKSGTPHPLNVLWQSAYTLERMKPRTSNTEAKDFIEEVKQDLYTNKAAREKLPLHYLEYLALACRLAELELRTAKIKNEEYV
jgi:CRISPR-associated protein Csm1